MEKTSNFYNRFSFLYPLVDYFLKPQKKVLVTEVNKLPQGNLLEIGVGNGSHLKFYKNHQITGIDISSGMLKSAASNLPNYISLIEMDGENLTFEDLTFEYVVVSHVIAVTNDPEKLINEAFRVMKPNGKLLILNHFTPENPLKYLDHAMQFIAGFFHLKSKFYLDHLQALNRFNLVKSLTIGKLSYFKLLIYQKK
jgi:phosphatidylethanolamine/phosphatidyl-N-methylethanolamine N-methyltransferase